MSRLSRATATCMAAPTTAVLLKDMFGCTLPPETKSQAGLVACHGTRVEQQYDSSQRLFHTSVERHVAQ